MDSAKLNDWLQVIGIFSLVASLIFVGLQMRQTQVIAQATLYQMRSDSAQQVRLTMIFPEQLQSGISKQGSDLTNLERSTMNAATSLVLDHFENSHHLYQLGMLSQEQWESDEAQLRDFFVGRELALDRWNDKKATYRKSFVTAVDSTIQEPDTNK